MVPVMRGGRADSAQPGVQLSLFLQSQKGVGEKGIPSGILYSILYLQLRIIQNILECIGIP